MRTAGIHLCQPPSPITAANQQQKHGAAMWAEGSHGNDSLASRRNNRQNRHKFRVGKESLQGQRVEGEILGC